MADIATYPTTTVQYSEVRVLLTFELPDKAYADELTADHLHQAVRMLCNDLADNPSVGLSFIMNQPASFEKVVPPTERAAFFRAHLHNPGIHEILTNYKLLLSIPEEDRAQLALDITSRQPMPDCSWVALIASTATDAAAFACIQAQLDTSRFTLEQSRPFATDFLLRGAGKVVESAQYADSLDGPTFVLLDNNPMWYVVPQGEFLTVIGQCLERAPELLFLGDTFQSPSLATKLTAMRPQRGIQPGPHDYARRLLQPSRVDALCVTALGQLTSLHRLSVDALLLLPLAAQKLLAERGLPGSLEFLVRATLQYDSEATDKDYEVRASLFGDNIGRLNLDEVTGTELLDIYRKIAGDLYMYVVEPEQTEAGVDINAQLVRLLEQRGYLIGRVSREHSVRHGHQTVLKNVLTSPSHKDRRLVLKGRKVTVVQNERQMAHFPVDQLVYVDLNTDKWAAKRAKAGERVIFGMFHSLFPN